MTLLEPVAQVSQVRQIGHFKEKLEKRLGNFVDRSMQLFQEGLLESIQEGRRVAERGASNVSSKWHSFHPTSYNAAARKGGINPKSTRGAIHWPKDLSGPCVEGFQPQWMQIFGQELPRLYDELERIIHDEAGSFHTQMEQKLPQVPCLAEIRAAADLSGFLCKMRDQNEDCEALLKRDLCDEVTKNVVESIKQPFEECKQIRGKGCFARMKEHVDKSARGSKAVARCGK